MERPNKRPRPDEHEDDHPQDFAKDPPSTSHSSEENGGVANPLDLIDVLPYSDVYTEADKQLALRLIEEEMKQFQPRDYLAEQPPFPSLDFGVSCSLLKARFKFFALSPSVGHISSFYPLPSN